MSDPLDDLYMYGIDDFSETEIRDAVNFTPYKMFFFSLHASRAFPNFDLNLVLSIFLFMFHGSMYKVYIFLFGIKE
jgi:hypothetical protein